MVRGRSIRAHCPDIPPSAHFFTTTMSAAPAHGPDSNILRSVIEHVFMPPKLPQEGPSEQIEQKINVALCENLIEAAKEFLQSLPSSQSPLWVRIIKMMESARRAATLPFEAADLQWVLSDMAIGGASI